MTNLPATQAQIVAALAANGISEPAIREELGMTARQWNTELKRPDSELAQALQDGRARIVENALAVVLQAVRAGDISSAKWLFEKFAPKEQSRAGEGINIHLTLPMSVDDYMRRIDAEVIDDGD